jgi:hypothetical protein
VSTLSISLSIARVFSGHGQRFIQQAGLYENGKKMKNQELFNTAADCVELSVKRLPSGFGSVRYLGKGRCNPYAVHPPESSAKTPQSKNRRPPALCYVCSRETGIKILMIYHAGLYAPGLENDPDLLNRLYKKAIGQVEGSEVRKGVRISWKGLPGIMISPDIVAESNAFSLENDGNIQAGGTIPASKGIASPGNPAGIPGVGYDYVPPAGRALHLNIGMVRTYLYPGYFVVSHSCNRILTGTTGNVLCNEHAVLMCLSLSRYWFA